jgi:hypothetical protein
LDGLRENKKYFVVRIKESARQTRVFAVRLEKHARQSFFKNRHFICLKCGRGENVLCRASWRKRTANKIFTVRFFRAHGKELICRAFFLYRALYKKRTANKLFAVRPKKTHGKDFDARQTRIFP